MATLIGWLGILFLVGGFILGLSALIASIFWLLWNNIVAAVFGAPTLTFLQAWGLWFLIGLVRQVVTVRTKA